MDLQTISVIIAAVSIVIATLYNALTIRNDNRTRQAQLYVQIFDKLRTEEFIGIWIEVMYLQDFKDDNDWMEKYGPIKNPEAASKLFSVGMLYQTIGMLVREKLIDSNLVLKENPWAAVETWEKLEPVVKGIRRTGDPRFWDSFEHLAIQIQKYREEHPN